MAEHTYDERHAQAMADAYRTRWEERGQALVRSLHRLADEVERELARPLADDSDGLGGTPAYGHAAMLVQHTIAWGLANAGAHYLCDDAAMVDRALADLRAAQAITAAKGGTDA